MATMKDRSAARHGRRRRTTVAIDHVLVQEAMRETGATTIAEAVEAGLKALVRPQPHVALAGSGLPPVAERLDDALDAEGFGAR